MDIESSILTQQAALLAKAAELQNANRSIPNLVKYFPQTKPDIEIQQFNLFGKLPARLSTEEDIAMWILESEHINRHKVCEYLGTIPEPVRVGSNGMRIRRDDSAKIVLKKIASKICSLEVTKGFVEGMKFFVPVVGCWDPEVFAEDNLKASALPELHRILTEYVLAHMKYSDKPIFSPSIVTDNHVGVIVEIALCVLSLSKVLHDGAKSNSAAMADFFAALRGVLRDQPASPAAESAPTDAALYTQYMQGQSLSTAQPQAVTLTLSMKAMTDLFVATSTGLPLTALSQTHSTYRTGQHQHHGSVVHAPATHPSYLFVEQGIRGAVAVGFSVEEPLVPYYARLGSDALYLFQRNPGNLSHAEAASVFTFGADNVSERGQLVACIPLESVHVRTHDSVQQPNLLALTGLSGTAIPYIIYDTTPSSTSIAGVTTAPAAAGATATSEALPYAGPTAVTFHRTILIDLSQQASQQANAYDNWVDAIESASWECRAVKSKPKHAL